MRETSSGTEGLRESVNYKFAGGPVDCRKTGRTGIIGTIKGLGKNNFYC